MKGGDFISSITHSPFGLSVKIIRSIFLLLGCLHLAVGSLNCLQIFAWANMLQDYSGDRSLSEAADMTFSGQYPCKMCKAIAEAKIEESKQQSPLRTPDEDRQLLLLDLQLLSNLKLTGVAHWRVSAISPRAGRRHLHASRFEDSVPTPPPRFAA